MRRPWAGIETHAIARRQTGLRAIVKPTPASKTNIMLSWAVTFLVLAIIAGILGFGGIAGTASGIAQILFVVFLILLVVSAVARALRGKTP